jgi:excisionase family DNA binding protein
MSSNQNSTVPLIPDAPNGGAAALLGDSQADDERRQKGERKNRKPRVSRPGDGYTVGDVARRYRVSEQTVRHWIEDGELRALNVGGLLLGKARLVVLPEDLAAFEEGRRVGTPKAQRRRRRARPRIDYYP